MRTNSTLGSTLTSKHRYLLPIGDLMVQPFPYKMLKLAEFYQLVDTIIIESKTLYIDIFDVKALYTYTFLFIHK